jgi:hypothetical protein
MAYISSTFNTTNTYVKYRLVVDLLSQDIVNNTSTVNVQLQAWRTNTGYETYGTGTASVNVEGTQFNKAVSSSQKITYNSFTVLYNANHTIAHKADGTKSPSIGGYFTINAPVSGGWNYFSFSLPTIPRASTVTATNAEIESATSININRFSESFTHTLKYSFGSLSGTVATGVATGYGWTVPSTFYAQIPNAKSGVCTITCETYSGETLIGSSTTTFTASVNETTNAPTVSASIIDTNAVTKALTDSDYKVVKFFSNMGFTITATAKNSATISSRSITCGSLSSTSTSGTLNAVESNVFVVTATDSRGISSSKTYNSTSTPAYPLVDYVRLTVSPTLTRTSQTGSTIAISYSGNYYNGTFGTVANTLTVKYRYRIAGTSTWSSDVTITPIKSGNTYSGSQNLAESFPYTNAYEFQVSAYDKLNTSGEVTVPLVVSQGIPVYDWNKTAFNVNVATTVPSLTVGSKSLLDLTYPVGAIYMSVVNTSPATLFGGTWAVWGTGRVPVAVDAGQTEFNTVEKTGGAKTHTHTLANAFAMIARTSAMFIRLKMKNVPSWNHTEYVQGSSGAYESIGTTLGSELGGTTDSGSTLPPYITCYMWKRTA